MEFEERLSTLEREKQRMELHVMMMEDTILGMKRENKSLKEMFIELLESCETISNHENQFTDLQMKFKSLITESETGSDEIKTMKTNLNALQNRDMKSFEKHAEHKRDIDQLKGKIVAVEKLCKEKKVMNENEKARDPCDKCRECVDLCVNISREMSAIKDDKLYYSSQVEKYEGLLADYRLTMDPQFTEQEIDAIINTEHVGELSEDSLGKEIAKVLDSNRKSNETLFEWIEKHCSARLNTPSFIRVLTTVVIESVIDGIGGPTNQCKLKGDQLRMRNPVLKKFLDSNPRLEMQALLALQYLMHRLNHPKRLLHSIFEKVYDDDVLSEEAFMAWEKNDYPAEQEGKREALKSLTQFFTWLQEAEDEDN